MSIGLGPVVETGSGKIQGVQKDNLHFFTGIPYAAPPVGPRRWLAPAPVEAWSGVRSAGTFGGVAPQNPSRLEAMLRMEIKETQSEDCLYLNVVTPGIDDRRRPVLFWIHGGGFSSGAGSRPVYDGRALASRDTVVVTINYRLNALGFLNLNEVTKGRIPATGNEGLLDQIAALEWARDNIAAFGGDPGNVTIFGESAGAMSVADLLAMPKARGLFHKAIPQSGAASSVHTLEEATETTERFLHLLEIRAGDVDQLRALDPARMLAVVAQMAASGPPLPFRPVVDRQALPEQPLQAIRNGAAEGIAVLIGSNTEEWKLFSVGNRGLAGLDEAGLLSLLSRIVPKESAQGMIDTYHSARAKRGEPVTPYELLMAMQTDRSYRIPAIRLAQAQRERNQPVYCYLFNWKSPALNGRLGACHALDVGFVFGTNVEGFAGAGPAVDTLAKNIQDAWASFARTGNPSCEGLGSWPIYGPRRETMLLGRECAVVEAPYEEERRAWEPLPDTAIGSF